MSSIAKPSGGKSSANRSVANRSQRPKNVSNANSKYSNANLKPETKSVKRMGMSRRTGKGSQGGSRRRKKKEDAARVIKNGVDVTPKPLIGNTKGARQFDIDVALKVETVMDAPADEQIVKKEDAPAQVEKKVEEQKFEPSDKWLNKIISLKISETETFTVLHIPGHQVWEEDEETVEEVTAQNEAYRNCLERHKEKDKFFERHAQTFNNTNRFKEIQALPPTMCDTGAQITTWDIFDSYNDDEEEENKDDQGFATVSVTAEGGSSGDKGPGASAVGASTQVGSESHVGSSSSGPGAQKAGVLNVATPFERILRSPSFKNRLDVVEQAIIQKNLHNEQLLFRNHAAAIDPDSGESIAQEGTEVDKDGKPLAPARLAHLWTFVCPLSAKQNISCMCFNKQNQDLLAVGYGGFKFGNDETGNVMFWSLKNPHFPQKVIKTKFGVTSLDFSSEHPHLLAIGLYDGSVAVYDIRDENDKPTLESQHATGKHSEPVWGVKWVAKEVNKEQQQLISISTDGSVQQWSMKKGLVPHPLMQLKRIPNKEKLVSSHMEGISREASGLCFDFPVDDSTQYFAGTEGGIIHKCSVSYNEQTLENFYGHTGPVYKVKASPFNSDAFLSASADWTCALWSQRSVKPLHVFQSGNDYMMDIEWSPNNSCVFGAVSRDGRVEVWDLNFTRLDPVIKHQVDDKTLSSVLFAPNAPVILTGASDGTIDVYRISGVELEDRSTWTLENQVMRLNQAMYDHSEVATPDEMEAAMH